MNTKVTQPLFSLSLFPPSHQVWATRGDGFSDVVVVVARFCDIDQ